MRTHGQTVAYGWEKRAELASRLPPPVLTRRTWGGKAFWLDETKACLKALHGLRSLSVTKVLSRENR
jgi:hypothetical protein